MIRSSLVAIQLPLAREPSVIVQDEGSADLGGLERSEGVLPFYNGCGDGGIRCNGRSKLLPYEKRERWCGCDAV